MVKIIQQIRGLLTDAGYRRYVARRVGPRFGYRFDHWIRVVYIDEWRAFLRSLPLGAISALEISPERVSLWREIGFARYAAVQFPEFDITVQTLPKKFDVIIADNVFEHLREPYQAARNVLSMLSDGGVFILSTPFMVRIHKEPLDFTRWTPDGLMTMLKDCGFDADVRCWGNRRAVIANLSRWRNYGWGITASLRNEPDFPATVWAYARRQKTPRDARADV